MASAGLTKAWQAAYKDLRRETIHPEAKSIAEIANDLSLPLSTAGWWAKRNCKCLGRDWRCFSGQWRRVMVYAPKESRP